MKEITTAELQKRLENGEQLNLIDVREADEVAAGMIPGAVHIPLGDIPLKMRDLDESAPYILICRSGGRSGRAQEIMADEGYDVTNMTGGMLDWQGPTE